MISSSVMRITVALVGLMGVTIVGTMVKIKGSRGETTHVIPEGISATLESGLLSLERSEETMELKRMHGVTRAHLANKVKGVSEGHTITLIVNGKGFQGEQKSLKSWPEIDQFVDKPVTGRQLLRIVEERIGTGSGH